jgi:DNA-binding CsgD family transcriptional regulator
MPPEALAFLERLHPHLRRAVRMGRDRFVYSPESLVGHALVNRLRQPVMLLTTGGEIVLANDAARRLLDTTSLVQVADNRLVLPQAYRRGFFEQCARMEHELRAGTPDEAAGKAFRTLHMRSGTDEAPDVLYGFYSMLVPERTLGSFGLRPLVMLFFYHPGSAQPIDSALLTAAFGLSHAECRIASLLADGMPLKDIAATLGVRYDTVRKQLMSIYQKTSTNRQPELVRLLMNLPASAMRSALEADDALSSGMAA